YWFNIVNTTAAPDGIERVILSINGTVPGPTIIADWGDTVVIHVTNSMENNGTGIHFHGIRQNYTNQMDGVPSITQC
ncbi:multicopper oxidase, partial [Zopfia rhizophila CBS 207.26]